MVPGPAVLRSARGSAPIFSRSRIAQAPVDRGPLRSDGKAVATLSVMTTADHIPGLEALWSDSVLPEHLASRPGTPEQRLARAVLDDAIEVVLAPMRFSRASRGLHKRTERWLASDGVAWPYSFVNICHALAVDPEWVRRRVQVLQAASRRVRPAA